MCQVIIRFRGEFIEARDAQAEQMMRMVAEKAEIEVDARESGTVVERKQWKKISDVRRGWRGDIFFRCDRREDVIKLFRRVEGCAIEVAGGGRVSGEVIPNANLVQEARSKGLTE